LITIINLKLNLEVMNLYNRRIQYTCSNCGRQVSKGASRCPHCGVRLVGTKWKNGVNPFEEGYTNNVNKQNIKVNTKYLLITGVCAFITLFVALFGVASGAYLFYQGEKKSGGFLIGFGILMLVVRIFAYFNGMPASYILIFIPGT